MGTVLSCGSAMKSIKIKRSHSSIFGRQSLEFILPPQACQSRQASPANSVFVLVSTIIGGGILSLPYTFWKAGCLYGPVMVIALGLISDFTVYLMILSSRYSGGTTYEEVGLRAFGAKMRYFTLFLLFLLLIMSCIGYVTLIRDLLSPLVELVSGYKFHFFGRSLVTLAGIGLVSPACFLDTLHSLRFNSVVSLFSIIILTVTIGYRSVQSMSSTYEGKMVTPLADHLNNLKWTTDFDSIIYVLPIISVAFLCHFNVLTVHMELIDPTRLRIQGIIHTVIFLCGFLYITLGLFGYLYARSKTAGNILNNFPSDDPIISIGRLALVCTLLMNFPLLVLPCRSTIQRTIGLIKKIYRGEVETRKELLSKLPQSPCRHRTCHTPKSLNFAPPTLHSPNEPCRFISNYGTSNEDIHSHDTSEIDLPPVTSRFQHITVTLSILIFTFCIGVSVKNIATIWNLMGSYVSLFIAYTLPAAFYLKIRKSHPLSATSIAAWIVFLGSLIMFGMILVNDLHSLFSS